ncbi:MAG TPA: MBL fold metallo-hydrolase [Rectinemataceae bacterium]|nr:MBL fold metallo-hydrolase [Rectinemataceae bacterium]
MMERAPADEGGHDMMTATVLGSGTCVPAAGRGAPGYLVRTGESLLLLDPGPGTLARLAAIGLSHRDIDLILLSHLHPDHSLDLVTFLQANNATPGYKRSRPLSLVGPKGLSAFLAGLIALYDCVGPEGYSIDLRELGAETLRLPGGETLTAALSGHTRESLCFRLESGGRVLVYSGDASARGDLPAIAGGADLLLCECSFPETWEVPDHLNSAQAGRIAQEAGAGRVVLTHLYPPSLETDVAAQVRTRYEGRVTLAYDGLTAIV